MAVVFWKEIYRQYLYDGEHQTASWTSLHGMSIRAFEQRILQITRPNSLLDLVFLHQVKQCDY
jgi:hypothetical protein